MSDEFGKYMRMAYWMKDERILTAIKQVEFDQHGVVALRFTEDARKMDVEILDEPYDSNVRVYPGE